MKLTGKAFDAFTTAATMWETESHVFFGRFDSWRKREIDLSVNWASIGDVAPEKAMEFADNLKTAVVIAEQLNELNIKLVDDADARLDDLGTWRDEVEFILENLRANRPYVVVRWFLHNAIDQTN